MGLHGLEQGYLYLLMRMYNTRVSRYVLQLTHNILIFDTEKIKTGLKIYCKQTFYGNNENTQQEDCPHKSIY
jgi:hypothetical protein